MPNVRSPRKGSMQFRPRKRARSQIPRVRSFPKGEGFLGFPGYKVGMSHVMVIDNRKFSYTKGMEISVPVTIIECPPVKVVGINLYKKTVSGLRLAQTIIGSQDKYYSRKVRASKKDHSKKVEEIGKSISDYSDARALFQTQPRLCGLKKKPEIFEMGINGNIEDKWKLLKESLNKELSIDNVLKENIYVDVHGVTKGKGTQGPVKRFGVKIRSHKSEKTKRGPGSLGGWKGQGKVMPRVAKAGQMGYFTRTEYNKYVMKMGEKPEEVNPKGGFVNYGLVKNKYLVIKGSVMGPKKRLIKVMQALRPKKPSFTETPQIVSLSRESPQGR